MSIIKFSVDHLRWLNEKLANEEPGRILEWCELSLPQLIQSTSFGPTGMVIADLLKKKGIKVPVLFIDTLHHFPETMEFVSTASKHYEMDLHVYCCKDAQNIDEFRKVYSKDLWQEDPEKYDFVAKVEPQRRALRELGTFAWITGRRRSQGEGRDGLEVLEYDADGRLKVNPLVHWDYDMVWNYIKENDIPYNPLHDKGYKSIGDWMTTSPVDKDAPERSGRWQGSSKSECGLHLNIPDSSSQL